MRRPLILVFYTILALLATACTKPKTTWPLHGIIISCADRGMYRITGADLARAGINPTRIETRHMTLAHYDKAVPLHGEGLEDGRWDPADAIYFFSDGAARDPITYINIEKDFQPRTQRFMLRLEPSDLPPARFKPVRQRTPEQADPAYPVVAAGGRLHCEQNPIFHFVSAGPFEGGLGTTATQKNAVRTDFIFWAEMALPATDKTPGTAAASFDLAQADPASTGTLRARFFAAAESTGATLRHRVAVTLNGKALGEAAWSGQRIHDAALPVPPGLIRETNRIEFKLLEPETLKAGSAEAGRMNLDFVMLDWFEVDYKQPTRTAEDETELITRNAEDRKALDRFCLEGFTSEKIRVFDLGAREVLQARPFQKEGGWAVNLQRPDRADTTTTLVAFVEERVRTPLELRPVLIPGRAAQPVDCELLILAHPAFIKELAPLVEWKRSRGLQTELVPVTDVFNELTGGYAGPEPLRAYIERVHKSQSPARLKYVLLVGDSVSVSKYQSFCPAYAYLQSGVHASDNYFAAFDKPTGTPMVAVGRISAFEPGQVANAVRKIIDYERGESPGTWQAQVLTIAAALQWARDDARAIREKYVRPNYMPVLLETDLTNPAPDYNEQVSRQLTELFNKGNLLTVFFGHGGGTVWEVGPAFRGTDFQRHLFDQDRVARLTNNRRLPVVCALTCYTNDFDNATVRQTLGETFVNSPGGAIAVIGTAARSSTAVNAFVLGNFMKVLQERKVTRLGDAFREAIKNCNVEMANFAYLLLGDPSLEFSLPVADVILKVVRQEPAAGTFAVEFTPPVGVPAGAKVEFFAIDEADKIVGTWSATTGTGKQVVTHTLGAWEVGGVKLAAPQRVVAFVVDEKNRPHVGSALFEAPASKPEVAASGIAK